MIDIDVAIEWIEDKKASYLCKEDKVVWFASITGRDTDKSWQEMSLVQVQRIMQYTLLGSMKIKHIVSAFQETGRIYEMGTTSDFQTPSNIFNFAEHSPISLTEKLIRELSIFISNQGVKGLLIIDLNFCFDWMCRLASVDTSNQKRNRSYEKYFGLLGYSLRAGSNRVWYNNKKTTAILHNNHPPQSIERMEVSKAKSIAAIVVAKVMD